MEVKSKPIKIIYDTDMGSDCDDAGTLAMLHRLCDNGEAELLAVTHCYSSPYVAGCTDAINKFYGREVPIGINYDVQTLGRGVYAGAICDVYPSNYPAEKFGDPDFADDTLTVLRKVLTEAEDNSITLVVTGTLCSMAKLALSQGDDISPLSGKELIAKKLCRTVVMGGRFFESWPMAIFPDGQASGTPVTKEWNVKGSGLVSAQAACDEWTGELVFASYELGSYIKTMVGYPERARKGDPVSLAYEIHNRGKGRCSWDQTAMLEAIRPGKYWNYHAFGRITVDDEFVTHWSADSTRRHTYLLPKVDYEDIRKTIDDIIDGNT